MSTISIQPRNFVLKTNSSFRFDFDVVSGEERIQSITAGGAIDDYNYLFVFSPNGKTREFTFNFLPLRKAINPRSILNMLIRIMDIDGGIFEFAFSKNYAVEQFRSPSIFNPRISQRSDGTKLIDIEYDYDSPSEIDPAYVYCQISSNWGKTWVVPVTSVTGDIEDGVIPGPNRKITWNPSVDLSIVEPTPISARIFVINSDGVQAIGNSLTGTLMILPSEAITPVLSIVPSGEKSRFGKQNGNLYKNNSIDFEPIAGSSSSSESSESSHYDWYLATGFTPDRFNGYYRPSSQDLDPTDYGRIWYSSFDGKIVLLSGASGPLTTAYMISLFVYPYVVFRQTQPGGKLPNSYPWVSANPEAIPGVIIEL
jgi:hypothetical protein